MVRKSSIGKETWAIKAGWQRVRKIIIIKVIHNWCQELFHTPHKIYCYLVITSLGSGYMAEEEMEGF